MLEKVQHKRQEMKKEETQLKLETIRLKLLCLSLDQHSTINIMWL